MGLDGFDVSEGYGAFFFWNGGGQVDIKNYGQVVGDVEVAAGELLNDETSGAD